MNVNRIFPSLFLVVILAVPELRAQAGPPFQTDDPTPVELGHYEFYIFGTIDGTPAELARPSSLTGAPFPTFSFMRFFPLEP